MSVSYTEQGMKNSSDDGGGPRSLLRSGGFLVATALGVTGVLCSCWIVYVGWQHSSAFFPLGIVFVCGFAYPWWLTLVCREAVRALHVGGALKNVDPASTVDVALEGTFRTLNNVLYYCFVAMLALLACVAFLLKHCR